MNNQSSNWPRPERSGRKANIPLLLALAGVAISMASESMGNESVAYSVFAAGVGCTILAILYTILFRR